MEDETHCPIWGDPATITKYIYGERMRVYSPRAGGYYIISRDVIDDNRNLTISQKVSIARWIFENQNIRGYTPEINTDNFELVCSNPIPRISVMKERFFEFYSNARPGDTFRFLESTHEIDLTDKNHTGLLMACMGASSFRECAAVIDIIFSEGLISASIGSFYFKNKGFSYLDEINIRNNIKDAFVAMWFDKEMNDAYDRGFSPAITDAGYKSVRVDHIDHNDKIDDRIISEIKKSRFIVADLTCPQLNSKEYIEPKFEVRGGVYFEAGFAKGIGLEVIFSCREDRIKSLHFDIRQFSHVIWREPSELREKLYYRIAATVGEAPGAQGLGRSNIISQAYQ